LKTLYLIDGHAQIFRAYYARFSESLNAPSGEPTKATYVFTQMLLGILRDQKPDYLAVTLDFGDASTERKQFYPEYKANRDATPEDFGPQVKRICQLLEIMKVPTFSVRGQEADDIIATIAHRLRGEDLEVRVVSRDKDLHQILTDKVKLWDPQKDEILDATSLVEAKGYTPEQAVEIQTLTGDSTDNVPGVPGIGPKKALGLVQKYGNVAGVVEHVEELTPKMRENVKAHGDRFDLTRRLVTLSTEVEIDFDLKACDVEAMEPTALRPVFQELGFDSLVERIGGAGESDDDAREPQERGVCHLVDDEDKLAAFIAELRQQSRVAIDTETTSLRPVDCDLIGISVAWQAGEGWYLPLRSNTGKTLDAEDALAALRPILEDASIEKVGQNIKYDIIVLRCAGIELRGVVFDTMVASYLLDSSRRSHGMDALAKELLKYDTISITELIGKGKKQKSMLDVELADLATYAAEDADVTWRLGELLRPQIETATFADLFADVEMPLVEVLAEMERTGVTIDRERLEVTSHRLSERVEELRSEIFKVAGHEFTLDSPKQLAEVLFDELGLRVVKKTKTGRSTDASVLQTLAVETVHPLPQLVLEYRESQKLLSTYVAPLPSLISERTGRVHASFNQTVTATGRLSSSDPNLQNIPVRTEQGREIRRAFVPSAADRVLITADYSQIELRILAHLSNDDALISAFRADEDIHRFVAAQIAGVSPDDVTKTQRNRAKAVNFGIIYGQGAFGLARSLGISRGEARDFIADYKARYPGIVSFMDQCVLQAETQGSVATMLGRRRPIPEIASRNRNLRALGERLAINTVVQGSAADLIKIAMVRIARDSRADGLDLQMLIQVHDELVLEAPGDRVAEYAEFVRERMATAIPMQIPVKVDVAWGENWLEGK